MWQSNSVAEVMTVIEGVGILAAVIGTMFGLMVLVMQVVGFPG